MALVNADGALVDNGAKASVSVAEAQDLLTQSDTSLSSDVAVSVTVEDDLDALVPHLDRIALIQLEFAHFKDGRHFTTAVTLRQRYGFDGEIRAVGDILPDQAMYLARAGFDTLEVPEAFKAADFQSTLRTYSVAYQNAVGGRLDLIQRTRVASAPLAAE